MRNNLSISIAALLVVVSIGGGVFFGLYSCGGYLWHKQLHISIMVMAILFVLFLPPKYLTAIWKRFTFIAMSFVLFLVIRAASSALYPATPQNITEFIDSFIRGVQYGPC